MKQYSIFFLLALSVSYMGCLGESAPVANAEPKQEVIKEPTQENPTTEPNAANPEQEQNNPSKKPSFAVRHSKQPV